MRISPSVLLVSAAIALLSAQGARAAAASESDDETKIKIAVLSLQTSNDQSAQLARTIVDLVSSKLDREGVFQVITEDDVKQMVSFDQMKTALSCDEQASCLGEIGAALGVPYVLTGGLSQVGSTYVLTFNLIDIEKAKALKRESAPYASVDEIMKGLERQLERAVAELLYRQKGRLAVTCSEEAAVVELDGKALGTTPFAEQEVPSGPHRVTVSKTGFIQFAFDVAVRPREQSLVNAVLVPSPEFLAEYQARAGTTRAIAWGTGIGAIVSAALGTGGMVWFSVRSQSLREETGTAAGTEFEANGAEYAELGTAFYGGIAGLAAAAGLAGTSAYFFATGEDPDRYDAAATLPSHP
jgi:TolB-like protein